MVVKKIYPPFPAWPLQMLFFLPPVCVGLRPLPVFSAAPVALSPVLQRSDAVYQGSSAPSLWDETLHRPTFLKGKKKIYIYISKMNKTFFSFTDYIDYKQNLHLFNHRAALGLSERLPVLIVSLLLLLLSSLLYFLFSALLHVLKIDLDPSWLFL